MDGYLLFYTSLNRNKKILAFSILETKEFHPILAILNKFLCKRYLNYYSVQIDVNDRERNIIILNLTDNKKEGIIKLFNIIRQKINKNKIKIHFLKDNRLERRFKTILINEINSNSYILNNHDSIILKDEKTTIFYDFYIINLENFENKITFIQNFLKFTTNFNQTGHLVFNIEANYKNNLVISPYFISKRENYDSEHKFERELNSFYNYNLIEKHKMEISKINLVLWRSKLFHKSCFFDDIHELFLSEEKYNFDDLSILNRQIESNLLKKEIKFKRLNKYLLFVEQEILIFTVSDLDYDIIFKILEKFSLKYSIFFLVLNERDYDEVAAIDYINLLENIKVMNPSMFSSLNLNKLKAHSLLKNTQVDGNILSRTVRM